MQSSKTEVLDHGFVRLVDRTGAPGLRVVDAARCSYGSDSDDLGERDRKLVKFLLGNGHTSPFRHATFVFHVKAPLFVFRQWWKYQVGSSWCEYETAEGTAVGSVVCSDIRTSTDSGSSWNELSGRYKEMEAEFYVPEEARMNTGKQEANAEAPHHVTELVREEMRVIHRKSVAAYERMLRAGVAKEIARLCLPSTIYSEAYWTVSLQAVLHFLEQRLAPEAQFEIRQFAGAILDLIRPSLEEMGIEFEG